MNKRERSIILNFAAVTVVTAIAILAMVELKNWVNRAEAMRAMNHLGALVLKHREQHGYVPPESYIEEVKQEIQGSVRLGEVRYRARWIDVNRKPDVILAYVEKTYRSLFFSSGVVVLRLDGRVEWMDTVSFKKLLSSQQSPLEAEMTK